jgi:hypothetical protein
MTRILTVPGGYSAPPEPQPNDDQTPAEPRRRNRGPSRTGTLRLRILPVMNGRRTRRRAGLLAVSLIGSGGPPALAAESALVAGKVVFTGMCEAAAASALDSRRLVLADRAASVLRVYDVARGGAPLAQIDLTSWLDWSARLDRPEIRGGARLGGHTFWLTSHARGRDGRRDPAHSRFFAIAPSSDGEGLQPVGRPYANLRKELLKVPELAALGKGVRKRGPLEAGGIDLAALAEAGDGRSLLIGFRSPVVEGHALLLPLLNPAETIARQAPRFGVLRRIDLGGRAIADLFRWRDGFVVVAAPLGGASEPRLFFWDGASQTPSEVPLDLPGLSPSAAVAVESRVLLLGRDRAARTASACQGLIDDRQKRLQALWLRLP